MDLLCDNSKGFRHALTLKHSKHTSIDEIYRDIRNILIVLKLRIMSNHGLEPIKI